MGMALRVRRVKGVGWRVKGEKCRKWGVGDSRLSRLVMGQREQSRQPELMRPPQLLLAILARAHQPTTPCATSSSSIKQSQSTPLI